MLVRPSAAAVALMTAASLACAHRATEPERTKASTSLDVCRDVTPEGSSPKSPSRVPVAGDLTPQEVDAISQVVRQEDALPLLAIVRRTDVVEVMTGSTCGALCGSGDVLILRKVDGRWKVVKRSKWVS
jgi:hypothetical protein